MSILQSLIVGATILETQSSKIAAISDNIANINTVGYRKSELTFQNLLGSELPGAYTPGGATGVVRHLNQLQGVVTGTASATDIAISGTGFFPVRPSALATSGLLFTRAGAFVPDQNGDFKNGANFYLQGWLLDDQQLPAALTGDFVSGATGAAALQTVNVANITQQPVPTTLVSIFGNLTASTPNYVGSPAYDANNPAADMANGAVAPSSTKPVTIVDPDGNAHTVDIGFLKTGANSWAVEIYVTDPAEIGSTSAQIAAGTITFNGDGTLNSVSPSLTSAINVSWQNVDPLTSAVTVATNTLTVNWGTPGALGTGLADGLGQQDSPYHARVEQNGFQVGSLLSVGITNDGYVEGHYDNGSTRRLFKLPLAVFPEQNELFGETGNVFAETADSGEVNFVQPNSGFGTLFSSALESSNVDIAHELADMIVAQRSYQFGTRIISTNDKMLETAKDMGA